MKMEDGDNREPDDGFDVESDSGWYFDLPSGAWERQEAKNRELRQSLRQNVEDSQPARDDPFRPRSRGLFGFGRKNDEAPASGREIAGGKWVLNRDAASDAPGRAASDDDPFAAFRAGQVGQDQPGDEDDDEWSTEAILPPVRELRVLAPEDEDQPQPETRGYDDAPRRVGWADAFPGGDDESGESSLSAMAAWAKRETPPEEPAADTDGEPEQDQPQPETRGYDDAPRRVGWADAFPGGDDESGESSLSAMAAWAKRETPPEEPAADADGEPEQDSLSAMAAWAQRDDQPGPSAGEPEGDEADAAPPVQPAAILPLRRRSAEDEPADEEPAESEAPSRWKEMFSGAPGEGNILEAMRSWSSGEMKLGIDEPEPKEPREIPPEFLKPFDWEVSAETEQPAASESGSSPAGEPEAPAAEAAELTHAGEPEPPPAVAETEPAMAVAATETVVSDWMDDESPKDEVASWAELDQAFEAPKREKKGLLSRLFGRKKKETEPEVDAEALDTTGAWVPATEDTDDIRVVARGAFGDFESEPAPWAFSGQAANEAAANAATFGAWLPAEDNPASPEPPDTPRDESGPAEDAPATAEVQFPGPEAAAVSEWEPEYVAAEEQAEPVADAVFAPEAEAEEARPSGAAEPAAMVEPEAAAPEESEVEGWDPEPFEDAVPVVTAANAAGAGTGEPSEPAATWGQADDEPVEEPWAVVDDARETPGEAPEVSFEAPSGETLPETAEMPVASAEDEAEHEAFAAALNAFDTDADHPDQAAVVASAAEAAGQFAAAAAVMEAEVSVADDPAATIEAESETTDEFATALSPFDAEGEAAEEPAATVEREPEHEDEFAAAFSDFDTEAEVAQQPVATVEGEPEREDEFAAAFSDFDTEAEVAQQPVASVEAEPEAGAFAAALSAFDAESEVSEELAASVVDESEDEAFAAVSSFEAASEQPAEAVASTEPEPGDELAAALSAFDSAGEDTQPDTTEPERPPLYVVPPPAEAEAENETLPDNVVEMPRKEEDDDPWAAFIASRRASGEPFPKGEVPADSNPAGWDEVFSGTGAATPVTASDDAAPEVTASVDPGRGASGEQPPLFSWDNPTGDGELSDGDAGTEGPEPDEPAFEQHGSDAASETAVAEQDGGDAPQPVSDDPWAAVAEASGYGGAPTDVAVYRGHGERPAPPPPEEPAYEPPSREPAVPPEPVFKSDWEAEPDEDDVVLKAFYEHANTELPEGEDEGEVQGQDGSKGHVLEGILGKEAAELVGESSSDPYEQAVPSARGWTPPAPFSQPEEPVGWQPFDAQSNGPSWNPPPGGGEPPYGPDTTFDGDPFEPEPAATGVSRSRTVVREIVETVLLAVLVFLCVRASFQNFKVDGTSMEPTLDDGQFLIVNKLVYSEVDVGKLAKFLPFIDPGDQPKKHIFHGPQRGDIVVLQDPSDLGTDLIKRVIGLPGDRIAIVNGQVYINGFRLEEPYIKKPWHYNMEEIRIPEDHYFVMGDNRDNSKDSRFSSIGTVQEDLIIGKAMFSYWPQSHFGLAPNASPDLTDEKPHLTTERIEDALDVNQPSVLRSTP